MTDETQANPFAQMSRLFGGPQAQAFCAAQAALATAQAAVLDDLDAFAQGWLRRRREGTMQTQAAARALIDSGDPGEALQAWQRWLEGSVARWSADGLAAQTHMLRLSQAWFEAVRGVMAAQAESASAAATAGPQAAPAGRRAA